MTELCVGADVAPARVVEQLTQLDRAADEPTVSLKLAPSQIERPGAVAALSAWFAERVATARVTEVERHALTEAMWRRFEFLRSPQSDLGTSNVGPAAGEFLRIRTLKAAQLLAERATTSIEQRAPDLSPSLLRMSRFVFEELGANVVQHSGRPETGFGSVSFDPPTRRLELAFADRGVGFLRSLQRNPELEGRVADDAEALQLAVTPRITGTALGRTNMGIGLKLLVDLSDLLGGDLWIASGTSVLHRRTAAGVRANSIRSIGPWRGAWIALDAPVG